MVFHWRYLNYVMRHKWYVWVACWHMVTGMIPANHFWLCCHLLLRGIFHDWTKFTPQEWFPYMRYFYKDHDSREKTIGDNEKTPLYFEEAWNHHQKRNRHHFQWYVRIGDDGTLKTLPMKPVDRWEMLCDWIGAGRALNTPNTLNWYLENKHKIRLTPEDHQWVERQIRLYQAWKFHGEETRS